MNDIKNIGRILLAVWLLALVPMAAWGAKKRTDNGALVWNARRDSKGRYTGYYMYVAQGFNVTLGANYYYGDIDNTGLVFNGGFQKQNFRGSLTLSYQHPLARNFNLRTSVAMGALNADNSPLENHDPKKFQSFYFEPSVCVDYYPVYWLGFYIFAGIGANANFIDYTFANPGHDDVAGKVVRFLPMVPFGVGWAIPLGMQTGVMLHVEVSAHQGVIDTPTMNLDAYPQTKEQNGVRDYGRSFNPDGKRTNQWADGYFQVGLTLSYRWRQ